MDKEDKESQEVLKEQNSRGAPPCRCHCCSGVSWDPNHTALWDTLRFFHLSGSDPNTAHTLNENNNVPVRKTKTLKCYCLIVMATEVRFDLSSSVFQLITTSGASAALCPRNRAEADVDVSVHVCSEGCERDGDGKRQRAR